MEPGAGAARQRRSGACRTLPPKLLLGPYCRWTKSCMTLRTLNYGNYGIFLIMDSAGFCPSTVSLRIGILLVSLRVPYTVSAKVTTLNSFF